MVMLRIFYAFSIVSILFSGFVVNIGPSAYPEIAFSPQSNEVFVYYFHYTRRCATCKAVEEVTENSLKELYPDHVESGSVVFLSVNLDEAENNSLAEKLKISGQTLLMVKGEKQVDLTNQAFMYARTKPEKLKTEIETAFRRL
jgi:hypothetical protein